MGSLFDASLMLSASKEINHKVNYKNAVFRPVQLVSKFEKCCDDISCEGCEETKHKKMKIRQVKAISSSPLHYEQTGRETLKWPPHNSVSLPDSAYKTGVSHFLFDGKEVVLRGRKKFVPEHMDGPVIEKSNDTFEDKDGNVWAFIPGESTSVSEMEEAKMKAEMAKTETALEKEREEKAKLARKKAMIRLKQEREKEKTIFEEEKAKTVRFLSQKLLIDNNKNNLLHQAALEGTNQIVKVFLKNNLFDLEAKNSFGETALACALKMANDEAFQLLREFGADLSQTFQDKNGKVCSSISRDEVGNTLLHQAVLQNDVTDVTLCLEKNVFDLEAKNTEKATILHCAAKTGNIEVVSLLLKKEAKLEARDKHGETPLFTAIRHQNEQVVEHLITSGANLEARNDRQETVLHLTVPWGNTKILQLLLKRNPNLLEAKDQDAMTPLFTALRYRQEEVAEQLIKYGADLEARNNNQETLLYCASREGYIKIVQLLLERKISLEARDAFGKTPLITAIWEIGRQYLKIAVFFQFFASSVVWCSIKHLKYGGNIHVTANNFTCVPLISNT